MRFPFPEPVILKRFLAPLWDFIFGIAVPSYLDPDVDRRAHYELQVDRAQALLRREDHGHELSLELRVGFDLRHIGELLRDPIHYLTSELRMGDLPAPEPQ